MLNTSMLQLDQYYTYSYNISSSDTYLGTAVTAPGFDKSETHTNASNQ